MTALNTAMISEAIVDSSSPTKETTTTGSTTTKTRSTSNNRMGKEKKVHNKQQQKQRQRQQQQQKVSFYPRVKFRRVPTPETEEEVQVLWYTGNELTRQKRREQELKQVLAKDDTLYDGDSENLTLLGLFTENERKDKYERMKQAKFAVFMEQAKQEKHFLTTTDEGDEDTLFFLDFDKVAECYLSMTRDALTNAQRRGLSQELHVKEILGDEQQQRRQSTTTSTTSSCSTTSSVSYGDDAVAAATEKLAIDTTTVNSSNKQSSKMMKKPKKYTRWTNAAA